MDAANQAGGPIPKATRREWIGLAVLALPCVVYSMDLNLLHLAVPQLSSDLQPSAAQLLWIIDVYGFLLAGFLIPMGALGDRIGRRRLLFIGAAAFGITSVLAAFANSAETLIAARALLGISAATLAPSTLSLIRNMFLDERERTFAIGVWVASFSAGGALGPLVGGLMLEHFWWGSVFLVAVPAMALLLAIGPFLLPEFKDPNASRMDFTSAAMATAAVLGVIYGMKHIAEGGSVGYAAFIICVGIAVSVLFVRRQKRLADPLIDIDLLRMPVVGGALSINVLALFIAFGAFLFIAQYLQLVLGMSPLVAGLWTAPSGVVFAVGSMLTPRLVHGFGPAVLMGGGVAVTAVGFLFLTQMQSDGQFWIFMTGFMLVCLGLAPVGTVSTDLVVSASPPERAGAASGISETSFEFGGALGIAVLGSLVAALYRIEMADAALPIPATLLVAAQDTLGGAFAASEQLEGEVRTALTDAAREAFVSAFRVACAVCVVLSIGTAAYARAVLRRARANATTAAPASVF